MNERQLTAIRACEQSATAIAKRHGWDEPHFYLPHSDDQIEFWRAAEALSIFLKKVEKADKASVRIEAKASTDEREEKASEPVFHLGQESVTVSNTATVSPSIVQVSTDGTVTSAASAFPTNTDETVISADTPVTLTLTEQQSANFSDVVGIGKGNQAALYAAGYLTWEDVLQAGIVKLRLEFPSISANRLRALFTRAQREAE